MEDRRNVKLEMDGTESGENVCAVLCTIYILQRRGIHYDEEWLLNAARRKDWLKHEGTPLYCLGKLLAYSGLLVTRKYDATIEDLRRALVINNDVIVGVGREKLYGGEVSIRGLAYHAIVVMNIQEESVTVFDPYEEPHISRIPMSCFLSAWKESQNYTIQILQSVDEYEPHPISVDNIPLEDDLEELQEAIAENVHDIWVDARIKEGWVYGKERNNENKKHPDLIPFLALPDRKKEVGRIMAFTIIRLIKKFDYDIIKRQK